MRGFGWLHRSCTTDTEELEKKLATVRGTLAMVRKERDRAFLLLRAARLAGGIPSQLSPAINGLISLESEGDIEDARNAALRLLGESSKARPDAPR